MRNVKIQIPAGTVSKLPGILKGAGWIIGDLILICDLLITIKQKRDERKHKAADPLPTNSDYKTKQNYNNHHHATKRKMKSLLEQEKDRELADFIQEKHKEWAASHMRKEEVFSPDDSYDPFS